MIHIIVNVPAGSPASVTNTADAFGGGDVVHTNIGNAITSSSTVTVVQVPASVTITSGGTQSAPVNTAFGTALGVVVKDAGGVVIQNQAVVFTAPPSGASGTFSNNTNTITANTNPSGQLSETFTANGTAGGPYTVSATAGTVSASPAFSLTNTGTSATVTNVSSITANGSYSTGAVINVTVTFSKAVNVTGTPLLALNSGGTAGYVSGSGTSTLLFSYTVAAGQNSAHLDYTSASALTLNGGTIQDSSNTPGDPDVARARRARLAQREHQYRDRYRLAHRGELFGGLRLPDLQRDRRGAHRTFALDHRWNYGDLLQADRQRHGGEPGRYLRHWLLRPRHEHLDVDVHWNYQCYVEHDPGRQRRKRDQGRGRQWVIRRRRVYARIQCVVRRL